MKIETKVVLESELKYIYENLILKSHSDENGRFWKVDSNTNTPIYSEDLYSGDSGTLLFLIEYYKYTKQKKVLQIIIESAEWLLKYCENNQSDNFSFYTGRTGTIYVLIQAFKLAKKTERIKELVLLLSDLSKRIRIRDYELLNGLSGTILGLLHIYAELKDEDVLFQINRLTENLITSVTISEYGYYWDKKDTTSKPLCGISHGSSGIGLVFLELSKFYNEQLFLKFALKAFEYENHYFDAKENNWPDFRNTYHDSESYNSLVANYISGNNSIFHAPRYICAWCHGAPGIGLTRIRALQLYKISEYRNDIHNSGKAILEYNLKYQKVNDSLCHGILGNNIFFLELYKATNNVSYLELFINACIMVISKKRKNKSYCYGTHLPQEDLSLFLGLSGIGLSFLQALNPKNVFSPLLPSVPPIQQKKWQSNLGIINKQIFKKHYPITYSKYSDKINQDHLSLLFNEHHFPQNKSDSKKSHFDFVLEMEAEKNYLNSRIHSFLLNHIKLQVNRKKTQVFVENFESCLIKLDSSVRLYSYNKIKSKERYVLFMSETEYKIMKLDDLKATILSEIQDIINFSELLSIIASNSVIKKEDIKNALMSLIQEGIVLIA